MQTYLVCYDIADPKRLRRVADCCEDFGYRKQLSVFLCRLSPTEYVRFRNRLYYLIDHQEDQILFVPLHESNLKQLEVLGRPMELDEQKNVVIVT